MNRREFTASLAAIAVTPALPVGLSAATAPQSAVVPAGTYAWAQLIARAQNRCSPAMLARQLHISTGAAQQLFADMLRDGVLRAPGAAGIARAATPIDATGTGTASFRQTITKLMSSEKQRDEEPPLVKDDPVCLGCENTQPEEDENASTDQYLQASPQER